MKRKYVIFCLISIMMLVLAFNVTVMGADKTIKIGAIEPLTGPIAFGGNNAMNGHIMAVDEINAAGGLKINDEFYKVELLKEDDKATPKEAAAAANKLISRDNVSAILGTFTSSCSLAAANIANTQEVPLFSPLSSSPILTRSGFKYFFRGRTQVTSYAPMYTLYFSEMGYDKFAVLAINDDWGRGETNVWPPLWEKLGNDVVYVSHFEKDQTDFYTELTQIKEAQPDALFVVASTEPASMIFRQAEEIIPDVDLLTSGGIDPWETMYLAGEEPMEGLKFLSVDPPQRPDLRVFRNKYEEKFGSEMMSNAVSAYDVSYILFNAIERANSTEPKAIRDALYATDYHGYMGHYYFTETGESFIQNHIGEIHNGEVTITHANEILEQLDKEKLEMLEEAQKEILAEVY